MQRPAQDADSVRRKAAHDQASSQIHNQTHSQREVRMRREVLSAAWPVMVSYVAVGLPCGVLAAKAGMGPLQNFVLALTFLSGGGQFMMSNLWLAGVPLGSIVASVAAVSTRFALYSASLAPYLERFGRRSALAISCCYTEEAYGITLNKLASGASWTAQDALALNLCVQLTWAASCAAGAALGTVVNVPTAIAGFAMTSLFIYLLYAQPHTRPTAAAAAAAALTVAACKWAGAAGVAVPLAALVGVAAGLAAGAPPVRATRTTTTPTTSVPQPRPQRRTRPRARRAAPNDPIPVPCPVAVLVRVHPGVPHAAGARAPGAPALAARDGGPWLHTAGSVRRARRKRPALPQHV